MSYQTALDREGREWAVLAIDSTLRGRLLRGTATPAVMDLVELVDTYGPLIMSPARPAAVGEFTALADTVGLVASDPETASIEQIEQVAAFAKSILLLRR